MMTHRVDHNRDEDCTINAETDSCRECGVYHGVPCFDCGSRGLHREDCQEVGASTGDYLSHWGESGGEGR